MTSARKVRGVILAVLLMSVIADPTGVLATPPSARPAQSSAARNRLPSRNATASAVANPLRATSPVKLPQTVQVTKTNEQAPSSPIKAQSPPPPAVEKPFVPNTGRMQIFRAAEKPVITESPNGTGTRLFPQGTIGKAQAGSTPVMRYEDVARGAALVPVKPRTTATAPATSKSQAPPAKTGTADAVASEPEVKRLPPLDRTAPRPRLPPGVKLPQEPIKIYPETDR
ncbi:MAG TPA: hypothetical protein VGN12_26230 [Pirellulales bacterium]